MAAARVCGLAEQCGYTALMHSARHGHTDTAGKLVRLGANLDASDGVRSDCRRIQCSRHVGDVMRFRVWFTSSPYRVAGARVLQEGWMALRWAVSFGKYGTAVELVRLGADINAKDRVGLR